MDNVFQFNNRMPDKSHESETDNGDLKDNLGDKGNGTSGAKSGGKIPLHDTADITPGIEETVNAAIKMAESDFSNYGDVYDPDYDIELTDDSEAEEMSGNADCEDASADDYDSEEYDDYEGDESCDEPANEYVSSFRRPSKELKKAQKKAEKDRKRAEKEAAAERRRGDKSMKAIEKAAGGKEVKVKKPLKRVRLIIVGIVVVLFIGAFGLGYSIFNPKPATPSGKTVTITYTVEEGAGINSIASDLRSEGIIKSVFEFKLQNKIFGYGFVAGTYELNSSMTSKEILSWISDGDHVVN